MWHKDAKASDSAVALRLVPGSDHEIERTNVPIDEIMGFSKRHGPSIEQIDRWFSVGELEPSSNPRSTEDSLPRPGDSSANEDAEAVYQSIRPTRLVSIYQVALDAGLSGKPWEFSRETGEPVIPPTSNLYQNTLWSFGGGSEPYLASIWWKDMKVVDGRILTRGNFRAEALRMANKKTEMKMRGERDTRLARKIKKAQAYAALITDAHFRHLPIRIAIVHGPNPDPDEVAYDSSKAEQRELDPESWWVHSFTVDGEYELVRGIEPPRRLQADPFEDSPEPGTELDFMDWLDNAPLSDTEKDALVKVRVGQGYFRRALLKRWKGCAVNQCRNEALLLASHIKPWSKCVTRSERLSPDNGILLSPTLDRAFDAGLISFSDTFKILLHPNLDLHTRNTLPIQPSMHLTQRHEGMKPFLKWHREHHGFEEPDVKSADRQV